MDTYESRFAYNINRLRIKSHLTQKQFADKLGYSEKTVSKWECVGSVPNISTLYKIVNILNVNIDELFRDNCVYFLGVDGGGTKTDFVLTDEKFNIVKEVKSCGCNPVDIGVEAAKGVLKKGIYEVCEGIPFSDIVLFAGLAGGASANMQGELKEFFAQFGFRHFSNGSDTVNIVSAGLGDADGVIIIMGTGSCAIAQHDGIRDRVSGWGYLFDDGGSGYCVARDALAAAFRYIDGSGEYTKFASAVLKGYNDPQELLGALYKGNKKFIASFCPLVFECAEDGDEVCIGIIKKNMQFAANIIKTAAEKTGHKKVKVVAAGGLSRVPMAMNYLGDALADKSNYDLTVLDERPVMGALLCAKKLSDSIKEEKQCLTQRQETPIQCTLTKQQP